MLWEYESSADIVKLFIVCIDGALGPNGTVTMELLE